MVSHAFSSSMAVPGSGAPASKKNEDISTAKDDKIEEKNNRTEQFFKILQKEFEQEVL
jgi:hypothetical protein